MVPKVDPVRITRFDRTPNELEGFIVFCVCVANKQAKRTAENLEKFYKYETGDENTDMMLDGVMMDYGPFGYIQTLENKGLLLDALMHAKVGQYTRIHKALKELVWSGLDLNTCTPEDLEAIPGIGPKTSRFFIAHSRPDQNYAVLDTHILAWLREQGHDVPKSTPTGKKYSEVEKIFLKEAQKRNKKPADFDLEIWVERSGNTPDLR